MATWIQSLSWTLIYSLGQGFVIYASLWLVLKLVPALSARVKYHLSLSTLTILPVWFAATWWRQFHLLAPVNEQLFATGTQHISSIAQSGSIVYYGSYHPALSFVPVILPWLSALYLVGLVVMLVRLCMGMVQLFSLRGSGLTEPGAALNELMNSLKNRLRFNGHVRLFVSAKAQLPMVIGSLKPIILMPAAAMAQLSVEQLETILLHELAHIKRYDYLVNILQAVVETMLFFNPFAWMVSAITRRERELCCDDLVLDHTGEPLYYATALATLATYPGTVSTLAVAASGQPNHLFNRIRRIMEMKKNPFSYSRMAAAILIITAISCSVFWLTPSIARPKEDKTGRTTTTAPTTPAGTTTVAAGADMQHETPAPVSPSAAPVPPRVPSKTNKLLATDRSVDQPDNTPATPTNADASKQDAGQLVQQLIKDHLINDIDGYVVERNENTLMINGKKQTDDIAGKYLQAINQKVIRVQVFPFTERLQMHPDAGFLQLLMPVKFSSGCVDYQPKAPGC